MALKGCPEVAIVGLMIAEDENLQEELPFAATGQIGMWFAEHALEHVLLHLIGHGFGGFSGKFGRLFMALGVLRDSKASSRASGDASRSLRMAANR